MTDRLVYKTVTVYSADTVNSTFVAQLPDGQLLGPIESNPHNLPDVGQTVTLAVSGAIPIYLPAGIAVSAIGSREISQVPGGLIGSDFMPADLTLIGQILNADTGQRAGLTPLGIQAWDDADRLSVHLDGVTNLMRGETTTAPEGERRVVFGGAGNTGRVSFIAPDGTETEVKGYTDTGIEAIRMASPVEDTWAAWNAFQVSSNEKVYISSGEIVTSFGGDTGGGKLYGVYQANDSGAPGVPPTRVERLRLDASRSTLRSPNVDTNYNLTTGLHQFQVGSTTDEGRLEMSPHGVADTKTRSPRLRFVGEGLGASHYLKFVQDSGGANPRIECTNHGDSGYGNLWAADFHVASSETTKEDIADFSPDAALDRLRSLRLRSWRRRMADGQLGPRQYGVVAEEAIQTAPEVVVGDAEAVSVTSMVGMQLGALQRVFQILDNARGRVVALEQQVQTLNQRLAALEARLP